MKFHFLFPIVLLVCISQFASAQCVSGDCQDGTGKYIFPSGASYEGDFKNGEVHGHGTCTYTDGSIYDGEWQYRFPHGRGSKLYPDKEMWTGIWVKGRPVNKEGNIFDESFISKGAMAYDGTDIQFGCIKGNCNDGIGTYAYADGSKYEGQFQQGKRQGWGAFYYQNGDKYVGDFNHNFEEGYGTIYYHDGKLAKGTWYKGEYLGDQLVAKGGIGCIEGDCLSGKGKFIYQDGAMTYEGEFSDGLPNGIGKCTYSNGEIYEGEWKSGGFNGKGTLHLNDGTKINGLWMNGTLVNTIEDAPSIPEASAENKPQVWAVVIGVSSYDHMHTLKYSDDDAYKVYAFLKSPEGGSLKDSNIKVLVDDTATREGILDALTTTFSKAGPDDLVMMYFSGHGLKGSFLPIDFDGANNKVFHHEITEILENSPAKFKLCIADACHSGSLFSEKGGSAFAFESFYKSLAQSKPGMALIMSSKSEETSLESNNLRQGVFSHFLLRGLKGEADDNQDQAVVLQELFDYICHNVKEYTSRRQSPIIRGDYDPQMVISVHK